ncbi:hypothetical protein JW992_11000 [candidate division KSB1 bacterium]|nr:hypothetical protein [candidate division KSB1 bacterium]
MRKYVLIFFLGVLALSCSSEQTEEIRDDVERKFSETRKKAEQLTRQEREEYARKIEREIETMQDRLNELKRNHQGRKTNPGYEVEPQIQDLEKKIDDMRKKRQEILTSGEKQWQDLKKRFDSTLEQVREKIDTLSD